MAFLVSPGVNTSEIDLTTSVPAVGTSTGATVGFFRWGPANTVIQVSSESDLVQKFFEPDATSAASFLSAANFLAYGNDLRVVRVVSTAAVDKSNNATSNTSHNFSVLNDDEYFNNNYSSANTEVAFVARYPGSIGNSLKVSVCAKASDFSSWAYASLFDAAPGTSNYATTVTGQSVAADVCRAGRQDLSGAGLARRVHESVRQPETLRIRRREPGNLGAHRGHGWRSSPFWRWAGGTQLPGVIWRISPAGVRGIEAPNQVVAVATT